MGEHLNRAYHIVDEGCLRKYRTEIPNTIIRGIRGRGLSLPARWLYVYFKSVCGDQGECWQDTTTITAITGISRPWIRRAFRELAERGLIVVEEDPTPAHREGGAL
jgi:hypothetical protein